VRSWFRWIGANLPSNRSSAAAAQDEAAREREDGGNDDETEEDAGAHGRFLARAVND
jgi:hypothetical protein